MASSDLSSSSSGSGYDRMCDAFEMLVERLTNIEQTTTALLDHLRYQDEHAPAGRMVSPFVLGRTDGRSILKHYDGRLIPETYVAVKASLLYGLGVVTTRKWAAGEERNRADDAVEAAIGREAADEVRRRVHEHYVAGYDGAKVLAASDFGLTPRARGVASLSGAWREIAVRHTLPSVVAVGFDDIVIKIERGKASLRAVLETVSKAFEIVGAEMPPEDGYGLDVYRLPMSVVPLATMYYGHTFGEAWKMLDAEELREITWHSPPYSQPPYDCAWLKDSFGVDADQLQRLVLGHI